MNAPEYAEAVVSDFLVQFDTNASLGGRSIYKTSPEDLLQSFMVWYIFAMSEDETDDQELE